jgi:hypothetical protein
MYIQPIFLPLPQPIPTKLILSKCINYVMFVVFKSKVEAFCVRIFLAQALRGWDMQRRTFRGQDIWWYRTFQVLWLGDGTLRTGAKVNVH